MQLRPILLAIVLLAGCSMPTMPVLPSLAPYKMDVQQGNVVTQEMIAKLQPGMTRSQVRFALGTPLVADLFHADRWDYVFLYQKAGVVAEQRRIVAIFKDDKLVRIEGDVVPASSGSAAQGGAGIDKPKAAVSAAKPEVAAAKPRPEAAPPPQQVEGANVVTGTGEPAGGSGTAREEKAKEEKPKEREQRGFFGRMLEKLGF